MTLKPSNKFPKEFNFSKLESVVLLFVLVLLIKVCFFFICLLRFGTEENLFLQREHTVGFFSFTLGLSKIIKLFPYFAGTVG